MLRYLLMTLLLTTLNCIAFGQAKYGTVTSDSQSVAGALIENLRSGSTALSGGNGDFIMVLKKGDTLLTSSPAFKTDTTVYNNQSKLVIKLKPFTSLLDEVTISERQLTPLDKLYKNQDEYRQIYRIGDDRGWIMILPGLPIAGLAINIDALYSHFSKSGKNARKLQKTLIRDYHDDVVDTRYTKSLVTQYTGYEGKQLDDFMIENRPSYEFMKYASNYDVIEFIIKAKKNSPVAEADKLAQNIK